MSKKIKVGILCGGPSSEREVSLNSGKQVLENLEKEKYDVEVIEITEQGKFLENKKELNYLNKSWEDSELKNYDVIFIALHGEFGEDGRIQALLDMLKIPYTCSGVLASALGIDKIRTDMIVKNFGIEIPDSIIINKNSFKKEKIIENVKETFGFPCVVKPNQSGSSVGITIVKRQDQLLKAIDLAFQEDITVIVQEFIKGRELTCGVLGNSGDEKFEALPIVEIIPDREFFDYEAKYNDKKTKEICPADILEELTQEIQDKSAKIHKLLGCDGLTRSDFIYDEKKGLYFLEINTIPGLTSTSLCPKEAKAAGMTYGEFLDKIIQLALKKNNN